MFLSRGMKDFVVLNQWKRFQSSFSHYSVQDYLNILKESTRPVTPTLPPPQAKMQVMLEAVRKGKKTKAWSNKTVEGPQQAEMKQDETGDSLKIPPPSPLLNQDQVWDLYKSFLIHSHSRIELESWHFAAFQQMLLQPYIIAIGSKSYILNLLYNDGMESANNEDDLLRRPSYTNNHSPQFDTSLQEKLSQIKEDAINLGLKPCINMQSWSFMAHYLSGNFQGMENMLKEEKLKMNTFSCNLCLEWYAQVQFDPKNPLYQKNRSLQQQATALTPTSPEITIVEKTKEERSLESRKKVPFITKSKIWAIQTTLKLSKSEANLRTYELFLTLFARGLNDSGAIFTMLTKMSPFAPALVYEETTYLVYIDALSRLAQPANKYDKVLFKYRTDRINFRPIGSDLRMAKAMIRYWVSREKPSPCFKILSQTQNPTSQLGVPPASFDPLPLDREIIQLLLEACWIHSREDPLTAIEILQSLVISMTRKSQDFTVWKDLVRHYGRYLRSVNPSMREAAQAIINVLPVNVGEVFQSFKGEEGEGGYEEILKSVSTSFGVLQDTDAFHKFLLELRKVNLLGGGGGGGKDGREKLILKIFMSGWIDGGGSEETLAREIKHLYK